MTRSGADLTARLEALGQATDLLARLDADAVTTTEPLQRAQAVLDRAQGRTHLSTAHTVVAFAGATGSGKSSLLNAVSGTNAATVGARRPTTAAAMGVYGGDDDGAALLDWLDVRERHRADLPEDLVLVDLPDVDSVRTDHHRIADALIEAVDVLVWVLDPQKYADAVVHTRYLRPMAHHAQITVVLLNQTDLLPEADREQVLADLHRRLADGGITPAHLLPTSATTGEGVAEVQQVLADFARARSAAHARLSAEVSRAADDLTEAYPPPPAAALDRAQTGAVRAAIARAAGVDQVADTVAASFRHRSRARTGWPLTRWVRRLRPDPLQRLHLPAAAPRHQSTTADDEPVTTVTSREGPAPTAVARTESVLSRLGRGLAEGTAEPWHTHLRTAVAIPAATLTDTLDATVVRHTPRPRPARWWGVIWLAHWAFLALLATGAVWLGVLAMAGYLQFPTPAPPQLGPVPLGAAHLPAIPWPTALLLAGLAGGLLLALIARLATRVGARRRRARTVRDLTRAIGQQVDEQVLTPAQRALDAGRAYTEALELARANPRRRARARA